MCAQLNPKAQPCNASKINNRCNVNIEIKVVLSYRFQRRPSQKDICLLFTARENCQGPDKALHFYIGGNLGKEMRTEMKMSTAFKCMLKFPLKPNHVDVPDRH